MDINVENVQDLGGFQFVLAVDSNLLRPVAYARTGFLGQTGREIVCGEPTIEAAAVRVACVTLRDTPPGVDGSGTIATVTLEPLSNGTSSLSLTRVKLVHPDGSELPSMTVDAQLTITGSSWARTHIALLAAGGLALVVIAGAGMWARRAVRRRAMAPNG